MFYLKQRNVLPLYSEESEESKHLPYYGKTARKYHFKRNPKIQCLEKSP